MSERRESSLRGCPCTRSAVELWKEKKGALPFQSESALRLVATVEADALVRWEGEGGFLPGLDEKTND